MTADIDKLYGDYQATPSPENLTKVVTSLKPTIDYHLAQHRSATDPLVRAKAMSFAVDAVKKYDPTRGASLPTFLSSQLRQLSRTVRQSRNPVRIPERIQIDSMKLNQAKTAFADEFGREPDTLELADYTSIPVKRIEKIHKYQWTMPGQSELGEQEYEGPDYGKEALEYVFHDSDHTDRRILEMKLGYGGHPPMAPKDIAVKLNLSPTQLSRRSMRLAQRINKIEGMLNK